MGAGLSHQGGGRPGALALVCRRWLACKLLLPSLTRPKVVDPSDAGRHQIARPEEEEGGNEEEEGLPDEDINQSDDEEVEAADDEDYEDDSAADADSDDDYLVPGSGRRLARDGKGAGRKRVKKTEEQDEVAEQEEEVAEESAGAKKRAWTPDEDEMLLEATKQHAHKGFVSWVRVAKQVGHNRTPKYVGLPGQHAPLSLQRGTSRPQGLQEKV